MRSANHTVILNAAPHSMLMVLGYSLIELTVTLFIGLIILGGVFQVVVTSKRSYLNHQEMTYIQENARFALDALSRDIRMAGYMGCANSRAEQANVLVGDVMDFMENAGITGFDDSQNLNNLPCHYQFVPSNRLNYHYPHQ